MIPILRETNTNQNSLAAVCWNIWTLSPACDLIFLPDFCVKNSLANPLNYCLLQTQYGLYVCLWLGRSALWDETCWQPVPVAQGIHRLVELILNTHTCAHAHTHLHSTQATLTWYRHAKLAPWTPLNNPVISLNWPKPSRKPHFLSPVQVDQEEFWEATIFKFLITFLPGWAQQILFMEESLGDLPGSLKVTP